MSQPIKFKYDRKQVVFFIQWKGQPVEILRANATLDVEQLKRLRNVAQAKANDLTAALKMAA